MLAGGQITVMRTLHGTALQARRLHATALQACALQAMKLHATALQACALHTLMLHGCALHGNALHTLALQGLAVQGCALHGNTLQGCALHGNALQGCALQAIALQGCALQAIALHGCALQAIALQPTHVCGTTLHGWHRVPGNEQAASQMPEFGRQDGFPLQLREQPGPQGGCTWIISSRNLKAFICSSRREPFLTEMGEEEVQRKIGGPLPCPDHFSEWARITKR
jgi:hypothetical protein